MISFTDQKDAGHSLLANASLKLQAYVEPTRWPAWALASRWRSAFYVGVLLLAASCVSFARLGGGTLNGDEAAFAFTTDHMRASGDWIVPYVGAAPHLNATPLYNWLTLAIAPFFDEVPAWYRFWSAVAGVGCVLLTFALGTILFRAEAGFVAALFLVGNRHFLFSHGVRFGGMDALTTFFISGAVVCYAWLRKGERPGAAAAWGVLGLCIGLAWLSKPPVFGCYFLTVIGLHHVWTCRREPWKVWLRGPLLAVAVGLAVAGPWYVAIWQRLGNHALHCLFLVNSVVRAVHPPARDLLGCHKLLWTSSTSFKLAEPAFVAAVCFCLLRYRRFEWGLLLALAAGYLVSLTAAGQPYQYTFYIFPVVCVLLAGILLDGAARLTHWCWPDCGTVLRCSLIGVSLAAVALAVDGIRVTRALLAPPVVYPLVRVHQRLLPQLKEQRCHFIVFDYPRKSSTDVNERDWSSFEDVYYAPRLKGAEWVDTTDDLKRLLEDGKPAVVAIGPWHKQSQEMAAFSGLRAQDRVSLRVTDAQSFSFLTFHDAMRKFEFADLADANP